MKPRINTTVIVLSLAICLGLCLSAYARSFEHFYVYNDKGDSRNHYAASGWMGDTKEIVYSDGWPKKPYSGSTCIKITYKAKSSEGEGWAGIYWQDPANNWGNTKGGFDLTGAKKLVFWVRGEKGGEIINDFFIGGIKGRYPDSCSISIGPIDLSKKWQQFEINLEGKDLSRIIGGFGWSTNSSSNPDGCTFYLDEIRYE